MQTVRTPDSTPSSPPLSKFTSSSWRPANMRHVPDVVLQRGHALLHGVDLGVSLSHRLHQVAVGLLRLIQQSVGCQQLRNNAHSCTRKENKFRSGWNQHNFNLCAPSETRNLDERLEGKRLSLGCSSPNVSKVGMFTQFYKYDWVTLFSSSSCLTAMTSKNASACEPREWILQVDWRNLGWVIFWSWPKEGGVESEKEKERACERRGEETKQKATI